MRVAVVGHVEWVEFARVPRVPRAGEIVHASEVFAVPGGGGAVAAVQLRRLAGSVDFLTALGTGPDAERSGDELRKLGVTVHAGARPGPQRRTFTFLDDDAERTITVLGERIVPLRSDPLPWESLADIDAIYLTGGDADAVRAARAARVLVATPRALAALAESGVTLDILVGSAHDPGEVCEPGTLNPEPRVVVRTSGGDGGWWEAREPAPRRATTALAPGRPAARNLGGDAATGTGSRRLRLRRLVRRRAGLRPRRGHDPRRSDRPGRPLRRRGPHRQRPLRRDARARGVRGGAHFARGTYATLLSGIVDTAYHRRSCRPRTPRLRDADAGWPSEASTACCSPHSTDSTTNLYSLSSAIQPA